MNRDSIATAMANFYGQIDFYCNNMSFEGQDFLRLLISKVGEIRFAPVALKSALQGMLLCIRFHSDRLVETNVMCMNLVSSFENLYNEVSNISENVPLKTFSLTKSKKEYRVWQIAEKLSYAHETVSEETKQLMGGYLLLVLAEVKVNRSIPNILHKLTATGNEILSHEESRAMAKLLLKSRITFSNDTDNKSYEEALSFNQLLVFIHRQKIDFADAKVRQGAMDYKTLPINTFLGIANNLREKCQAGNKLALKVILASFFGIPFKYINQVPLLKASVDDWRLVLDLDDGCIKFDLSTVAPDGAITFCTEYREANQILVKPLPIFAQESLKIHWLSAKKSATNIGDLLGAENDTELYTFETIAKFINSFSRVAVQYANVDPFDAGLIACDFRGFPSSKVYYRQTSRQDIWVNAQKVFDAIGWGDAVPVIQGLSFGSQAVLTDETVRSMFATLAKTVYEAKPSNNSKVVKVMAYHEAFTIYCATLAVFCLALRESAQIKIYANEVARMQKFLLVNDKAVHGVASLQPVTINDVLSQQFRLYKIHCATLRKRLGKMGGASPKFIAALHAISSDERALLFITEQYPQGIPTSLLTKHWGVNIVGNFGRHYWESTFSSMGVNSRESATHLRHQTSENLNWSATSDLVLNLLIERINDAQVAKLKALDIQALNGLSGRSQK